MTIAESMHTPMEAALLARLPQLLTEVREGLSEHWPDYADFLETDRRGVEEAAGLFTRRLLVLSDGASDNAVNELGGGDETLRMVFEQVGRRQVQEGNDLTKLLTAFQLGARIAWRHVSAAGLDLDVPPETLAALADAVFAFVNQLSSAAAQGYVSEQAEDARSRERYREELAALLLSDRASTEAVHAAAASARCRLPAKAVVVLIDPGDDAARAILHRLEPGLLTIRQPDLCGVIVPDPGGSVGWARLSRQLQGANAVVGSAVELPSLPRSAELAQAAARLLKAGVLHGDPVLVEDNWDTIIVWRDGALMENLRRKALAPLDGFPQGTRARQEETLRSWLRCLGDRRAMAEELSIHPQTVRYRMAQLHEAFGGQLDSPRSRMRLFLALEWPSD